MVITFRFFFFYCSFSLLCILLTINKTIGLSMPQTLTFFNVSCDFVTSFASVKRCSINYVVLIFEHPFILCFLKHSA